MFIYGFHLLVTYFKNDILFTKLAEESDILITLMYIVTFLFLKKVEKVLILYKCYDRNRRIFFLNCRTQNKKKAKMST